jgi:hypothetical protein
VATRRPPGGVGPDHERNITYRPDCERNVACNFN